MSKTNFNITGAVEAVPGTRCRSWRLASLRFACVAPPLLISTLLVVAISPALPDWAGSCLFYGGLAVAALLVAGVGECVAVRFLFGARSLTRVEATGLSAVVTDLCQFELGPPVVVYVSRRPRSHFAVARGRRSVLLSHEFVTAILTSQLATREAVAAIAHASLTARSGLVRHDPFVAFWSLPWTALTALGGPPRGVLAFAWKIRAVVFSVAIWQCLAEALDRGALAGPAAAIVLAVILVLTYVWPRWLRSWGTAVTTAGDLALVAHGLGTPMATLLRRLPQTRELIGRVQILDPPVHQRPGLRLVGAATDQKNSN